MLEPNWLRKESTVCCTRHSGQQSNRPEDAKQKSGGVPWWVPSSLLTSQGLRLLMAWSLEPSIPQQGALRSESPPSLRKICEARNLESSRKGGGSGSKRAREKARCSHRNRNKNNRSVMRWRSQQRWRRQMPSADGESRSKHTVAGRRQGRPTRGIFAFGLGQVNIA